MWCFISPWPCSVFSVIWTPFLRIVSDMVVMRIYFLLLCISCIASFSINEHHTNCLLHPKQLYGLVNLYIERERNTDRILLAWHHIAYLYLFFIFHIYVHDFTVAFVILSDHRFMIWYNLFICIFNLIYMVLYCFYLQLVQIMFLSLIPFLQMKWFYCFLGI